MAKATAQSNVEIVQDAYTAFNAGNVDAAMAIMAEDIEWTEPEGTTFSGTYHTPEAVLENVFKPTFKDFEEFQVAADRFIDGGDTIVVLGTYRGTSKESGERLGIPFAHVCEMEDGRLTGFVNYTNPFLWEQAIEA